MNEPLDTHEQRLFDAACTGRLDDSAREELETLLRGSAGARRRYLDYASMHADLFGAVRVARVRQRLIATIESGESESESLVVAGERRSRAIPSRWLAAGFMIAATILLAMFVRPGEDPAGAPSDEQMPDEQLALADDNEPWPGLVGSIRRVELVEWGDGAKKYAPADLIAADEEIALNAGLVEIEFRQGAVVVLEGPARLIANDANGATLLRGKLAAVAPPWATGFRVDTPGLDVVDHGTEFAVSVSGDASDPAVNVVVTEGEVEVLTTDQTSGGRRLKAGEGVRSTGAALQDGDDADARQLTSHLPDNDDLKNASVVGNRWTDWTAGVDGQPSRDGPWRYYTNSSRPFGFPNAYDELIWHAGSESYRHRKHNRKPSKYHFVRAHRDGGHPGKGAKQSKDGVDHYSITGFIVPEDGVYRIEAGWLERRWVRRWDRDDVLDIAIHVNDGPIVLREFCDRNCFVAFRTPLGRLSAGDTVYVGVGPNGIDHNDRFRWGFNVVREYDPPPGQEDLAENP